MSDLIANRFRPGLAHRRRKCNPPKFASRAGSRAARAAGPHLTPTRSRPAAPRTDLDGTVEPCRRGRAAAARLRRRARAAPACDDGPRTPYRRLRRLHAINQRRLVACAPVARCPARSPGREARSAAGPAGRRAKRHMLTYSLGLPSPLLIAHRFEQVWTRFGRILFKPVQTCSVLLCLFWSCTILLKPVQSCLVMFSFVQSCF